MKTIAQYVETGVLSLDDLKGALQLAMQLEFATIPPYLCAQWSIKRDPDRLEGVLHRIVSQEMQHFALAGNLLAAIGGTPKVAHRSFIPKYPVTSLPGGIAQKIPVDLAPLTPDQIEVFMQIEYPDFPPIALFAESGMSAPATIGAFYDTIIRSFQETKPYLDAEAHCVEVPFARPLRTLDDAIESINRIKSEGEGLRDTPEQPSGDHSGHAHYYLFKEMFVQRRLVKTASGWAYSGARIELPEVYTFGHDRNAGAETREFRRTLSKLMHDLEACWASGQAPNVVAMFELKLRGQDLVRKGIRPDFSLPSSFDFVQ